MILIPFILACLTITVLLIIVGLACLGLLNKCLG